MPRPLSAKKKQYLEQGIRLRKYRLLPRTIMTIVGKVEFSRMGLIPSTPLDAIKLEALGKGKIVFPIDEVLGIDRLPFKISVAAMLEIVWLVHMTSSYESAKKGLNRQTSIDVSDVTIRAVANTIGEIIFLNDVKKTEEVFKLYDSGKLTFPEKKITEILYIEVDGSMVNTRRKDANDSSWKENKLGMVFSSDNIHTYRSKNKNLVDIIGKREYIPYLGNVENFTKHLFTTAIRNGYGTYEKTIIVSDGALWIKSMRDQYFPDAIQILDFFHLCEKIYTYAKAIFNNNEDLYQPWADTIADLFRDSETGLAIKMIKSVPKRKRERTKIDLLGYIDNHKNHIDYANYIRNNYYIGSGAIESGNKSVIQARLKQSGMRWNLDSGQFIVSLMAKAKSNLWKTEVEKATFVHFGIDVDE
jgi:hypothetical protein